MPRPGPLSKKKKRVIAQQRVSLGDSSNGSESYSDDATAARTPSAIAEKENRSPTRSVRSSRRLTRASEGHFHTPENENNATDYGLEFTTSHIQNPSPRRCSTLRTASSQEEQQQQRQSLVAARTHERQEEEQASTSRQAAERMQRDKDKQTTTSKLARKQLSKSSKNQQKSKGRKEQSQENESDSEDEEEEQSTLRKQQQTQSKEGNKKAGNDLNKQKQTGAKKRTDQAAETQSDDLTEEDEEEESEAEDEQQQTQINVREDAARRSRRGRPAAVSRRHTKSPQRQANVQQQAATAARKPRKQRTPMQKDKRFWREIHKLQNRVDFLIPRLPFSRLIRELMHIASHDISHITATALEALQTASEMYLSQRLQDAYMLTLHRGRVTLEVRDMQLINYLRFDT